MAHRPCLHIMYNIAAMVKVGQTAIDGLGHCSQFPIVKPLVKLFLKESSAAVLAVSPGSSRRGSSCGSQSCHQPSQAIIYGHLLHPRELA
jgi:hypothetical protein